ncbi:mechanosensitive ion channel [Candidatus Woesearchaeota archaeon]|nr:mechanosensitive ion channel [Candidatus Woesearchaeota archaeon]
MIEILANIQNYFFGHYTQWLFFIIIFIGGFVAIHIISKYVTHFFDKVDLDRTLEVFIEKIVKIFLWVIFIIIVLSNLGFNVTGFVAGLGAMGIIIGFATKDVLSNLTAGIFLLINKPMKIGESVEVVSIKGTVKEMGISSCIVITDDQVFVTIPNSKIWGNPIKNFSRIKKK